MTLREVLQEGQKTLLEAGIQEADLDAWLLLEYVTGIDRARYYIQDRMEVDEENKNHYFDLIRKRAKRIPLQHLTHVQQFMGLDFYVNECVLVPRQDTELLVEEAELALVSMQAARLSGKQGSQLEPLQILDLCTGSGCILLSLLRRNANVLGIGVDISREALEAAEKNRQQILMEERERALFVEGDLFQNLNAEHVRRPHTAGPYDLIVSNPPYIKTAQIETLEEEVKGHDPYLALDGKEDGLYFYRKIIKEAPGYLRDGGRLLFEIGHDQAEAVSKLMVWAGFARVTVKKDLAGLDRVVHGVYNKAREN